MENELMQIIQSFKTVLDDVMARMEALEKRQGDIEKMIIEEFLDPLKASVDDYNHNAKLEEFKAKVGDKFDPYLKLVEKENGEDFDLYDDVMNAYDSFEEDFPGEEKPTEEEFIDGAVKNLQEKAEELKAILNADEVEVKADAEGEVTLIADGEVVADTTEEPKEETAEETTEEPAEEEKAEDAVTEPEGETVVEGEATEEAGDEEEAEDTPEEIEADLAELEKEMERYR